MLVVISDLHLADESTSFNVHPTAFSKILGPQIRNQCMHNNASEIHLVLLGDIIDLCRTDYWHRENINANDRPWGGELDLNTGMNNNSDIIEKQYNNILEAILGTESCQSFLDMIRSLSKNSVVPVRVTYIIGNHDRVFHNFPSLQHKFKHKLCTTPVEFKTCLIAPGYGVFARHGYEWDSICHGWKFARKLQFHNIPKLIESF